MADQHQFDFRKIVKWFSKEEVKTPLSFFFKVIPYMTAVWIAILYSPIPNEMKLSIVHFSGWVFIGLCGLIALFAFINPRNLVYGEAGHRAERKIEMGTETKTYSTEEFDKLNRGSNPKQIGPGRD